MRDHGFGDEEELIEMLLCEWQFTNSSRRQYKRENNLIRDPCSTSSVTRMAEKYERTYSLHDEKHKRSSLEEDRKELIAEVIEDSRQNIGARGESVNRYSVCQCPTHYEKVFLSKTIQACDDASP